MIDRKTVTPRIPKQDEPATSRGRPVNMIGGKRINVYLDTDSLEIAAKIGGNNISQGIRTALKSARRRGLCEG